MVCSHFQERHHSMRQLNLSSTQHKEQQQQQQYQRQQWYDITTVFFKDACLPVFTGTEE